MKKLLTITVFAFFALQSYAQSNMEHISKLEIGKKAKKVFNNKSSDSISSIHIDTLIMDDKASLIFYGQKNVNLTIGNAIIGNNVSISGTDGKNNGSHFNIQSNFKKLGSLYIIAKGDNAFNGTKTYPNGNGGNVKLELLDNSIHPQLKDKKETNYLRVSNEAGGKAVNATSDLRNIYDRVRQAPAGLRGLPQGQIYSGSPGIDGKTEIISTQ
ncbi:hypothetical protein LZQ00_05115 [Sphingobacterium sp. SRCM116780]|uniref:hypothetical protein n=1 Tax=Sphingobacterium sp. SRCM116780 TaxID=2907623 RepID=UPI001F490EAE|nr:hypothetical protein [Sphingobacterium sp. SRCM116780]UIR57194.1 hypothetical protein LZQ00_05115 [Sphingobacterium sp. SRCM116780]